MPDSRRKNIILQKCKVLESYFSIIIKDGEGTKYKTHIEEVIKIIQENDLLTPNHAEKIDKILSSIRTFLTTEALDNNSPAMVESILDIEKDLAELIMKDTNVVEIITHKKVHKWLR